MNYEKVSVKRHILKSISYRVLGSLTTILIAMLFGVPIVWASMLGATEILIKPIIYFLHERVWYKFIRYGIRDDNSDKVF